MTRAELSCLKTPPSIYRLRFKSTRTKEISLRFLLFSHLNLKTPKCLKVRFLYCFSVCMQCLKELFLSSALFVGNTVVTALVLKSGCKGKKFCDTIQTIQPKSFNFSPFLTFNCILKCPIYTLTLLYYTNSYALLPEDEHQPER